MNIGGRIVTVPMRGIRGIQFNGTTGTSIVFYDDQPGSSTSRLIREDNVLFVGDAQYHFITDAGVTSDLKLSAVKKYTAKIK